MMLMHRHKHLFMSCPKTGTMSIYLALMECGGVRHGKWHQRKAPPRARGYRWIGAVRNPYSRAVSLWRYLLFPSPERKLQTAGVRRAIGSDHGFPRFCLWLVRQGRRPGPALFCSQERWYRGKPIKKWLRTESLEDDFCRLAFSSPIGRAAGQIAFHRLNTTEHKPWREVIDDHPDAIPLVNEWAGNDFEVFNYERIEA